MNGSEATGGVAIRCCGLTKVFGTGPAQVVALRGVDLEVWQGELLMLMGPSGCGKTTLISIISALLTPDTGRCEVLGRDLANLGEEERTRFRGEAIGFVFQLFNLFPALTALDNVAVPLLIRGVPRRAAREKARSMLAAVGLAARETTLPGELSGGQQQRVAIARALVHDPQLVVCDEPTSSLDHLAGVEMMRVLREIARDRGRTLLVVTHDQRILDFADRVAQMDDGRVLGMNSGGRERLGQ